MKSPHVKWPTAPGSDYPGFSALLQLYLPSMLIVVLSWVTFWVEMDTGNQVGSQGDAGGSKGNAGLGRTRERGPGRSIKILEGWV